MEKLIKRIEKISNRELTILLNYTPTDNIGTLAREILNNQLAEKINNDEIDEIELIIVESGN